MNPTQAVLNQYFAARQTGFPALYWLDALTSVSGQAMPALGAETGKQTGTLILARQNTIYKR